MEEDRRRLDPEALSNVLRTRRDVYALANYGSAGTADGRGVTRKTMIVALARKLLIALWRYVTTGEVPAGARLKVA